MRTQVRSLALLCGLSIRRCREVWCRWQTQLRSHIVWLWCRLVATALMRPLAWKPPHAVGVALTPPPKKGSYPGSCEDGGGARAGSRALTWEATSVLQVRCCWVLAELEAKRWVHVRSKHKLESKGHRAAWTWRGSGVHEEPQWVVPRNGEG